MAELAQAVSLSKPITRPNSPQLKLWQGLALLGLAAWIYAPTLSRLVGQWWSDPNFSHGFFVPAFSFYVLWQNRAKLKEIPAAPSNWGLPVIVFSMAVLLLGVFGVELFLSRISLVVLATGMVIFFSGWQMLRAILFPLVFLVLMVPIPAIIFNHLTFPLQILASELSASLLPLVGVPVFREGNIINLPAMPLEVADACSGIHSLLSLATLAIMYGYLLEKKVSVRVILAVASIPIAVAANALRIVGTGLLVQFWDADKAQGFFHEFSGWLIFVCSLLLLFAFHRALLLFMKRKEAAA